MEMQSQRSSPVTFTLMLFLIATGCTSSHTAHAQEQPLLVAAKIAADQDNVSLVEALEPKALATMDADATRQGPLLSLRLKSGSIKTYENLPECKIPEQEARCERYSLVAHVRSYGIFVVLKLHYESAEYLLVSDVSGKETTVHSFPIFSASGNYVLILLMNDDQVGFAVQIWRRAGGTFALDWSGSPYTDGMYTTYKLLHWRSEGAIELQAETSFERSEQRVLRKNFKLRHSSGKWNLIETK